MTLLPNKATRYERALEEACGWFKDLTVDIGNFYRVLPEVEEATTQTETQADSDSETTIQDAGAQSQDAGIQSESVPDYTSEQGQHTAWQGKPTAEQNEKRAPVCPKEILPHLAYAFSVDEWDETWLNPSNEQSTDVVEGWSEHTQRRVVDASLRVHRKKGTRRAIEEALSVFGALSVKPVEWWELKKTEGDEKFGKPGEPGEPGTFDLEIELAAGEKVTSEMKDQIYRILDATKNCRSHLRKITLKAPEVEQAPIVSSVAYCGEVVTVFENGYIP